MFGDRRVPAWVRFEGVEFAEKARLVGCDPLLNRIVEMERGRQTEQMFTAPVAGEVLGEFGPGFLTPPGAQRCESNRVPLSGNNGTHDRHTGAAGPDP